MGISETLGNLYVKVEDAYYGILDFFEEKGIGIPWAYNDFLESKGIPGLPVTLALLLLVIGGAFWVTTVNQPQTVSFTLSLKDDKGRGLEDVSVQVLDAKGNVLKELTASDGSTITLSGILANQPLTIKASKQGYGSKQIILYAGEEGVSLALQGSNEGIIGKLKLVDAETQTTILDVVVSARWPEASIPLVVSPGADGIVLLNVPLDQEISLTVRADEYEDLVDIITFTNADVKIKELTPKASASSGPSVLLVKAVDEATDLPLPNVHIKIENAQTNETISDLDASTGQHSENLTKGLVVRVIVSKEGYATFSTSTDFPEGKTLRSENETIIAELGSGGTSLFVHAQNDSGKTALQNVELELLDSAFVKMDGQTTSFTGDAEFGGLVANTYTLLSFHPNYFPLRSSIELESLPDAQNGEGKQATVSLIPFTSGNAGVLTVFVTEKDGKAASQARVSIEEKVGEEYLPFVLNKSVDSLGSFTARLPVGKTVKVVAATENASAEKELTIAAGLNKVVLNLDTQTKVITFKIKYQNGNPFSGNLVVQTNGGNEWYNGSVSNGEVGILVPVNATVNLTATSADGKTYTKTVTIPLADEVEVILGNQSGTTGNAPELSFDGLYDAEGNPAPGLSPESDAFARFTIKWPSNTGKGGLFVRVGEDSVSSVDSQFVGIYGVNGEASEITYGRSWTPLPKPGNEAKDRKTVGKAGSLSKWVEIIQENPVGTSTIDVRLHAREGIPSGTQKMVYRAFGQTGNSIGRTPNDPELGNASYTQTKSGLYAHTLSLSIPIYESHPFCQSGICATLQFVDRDNRFYPIGSFRPVQGQMYALHTEILPGLKPTPSSVSNPLSTGEGLIPPSAVTGGSASGGITVKASTTPENPLLVFTKSEINNFGALEDTGKKDTSLNLPIPAIDAQNGTRIRVHFLPETPGQTTIQFQLVSSRGIWQQTLPIEIVEPKFLRVSLPNQVNGGEAVNITILDEQGNPIPNGLITLTDAAGKFAGSVKGNNSPNKGENGKYVLDKSLENGLYSVKIRVPGFADYGDTINVGMASPLSLPEKVEISIPFGQTTLTQQIQVTNKTKYPIANVTSEFVGFESFPKEIKVDIPPIPLIAPNGKANVTITATFTGNPESEETLVGSGQLKLRGEASQKFVIRGESQLTVSYNKKLDSSCLQFNKNKLTVVLMAESQPYGNLYPSGTSTPTSVPYYGFSQNPFALGQQGSGFGVNPNGQFLNPETKRVNVKAKNNCGTELTLIPGISNVDGQLEVDGLKLAAVDSALKLGKGEEKQVDFTITNELFRAGFIPQSLSYAAFFRAPNLYASLPFEITFWDRSRAIQTPPSVQLQLIRTGNSKASDRATIPITNIGSGPIYDLRVNLEGEPLTDVSLKIENNPASSGSTNLPIANSPYGSFRNVLLPGQSLYPPVGLVGESLKDKEGLFQQKLVITGVIEGKRLSLRTIDVFITTGSSSCLELSAFDTPISFISSELTGTLSKRVTIQNKCLEPVRITQVNPETAGGNIFTMSPVEGTEILEKDESAEFQLLLNKTAPYKAQFNLNVKGLLILSQKPIESNFVPVDIALGKDELQAANASNPVEVPVCEGGTLNVRFPLLAKKDECTQAYCDAEQASNMLANLIENQLTRVVQQMQAKKNDATQFSNCDITKRYCTFAQLGIKSLTADLYLQNDALTRSMLNFVMADGRYPRLTRMQSELETLLQGDNADTAFAQRLGTGFGNKVFLPIIQGCGYYKLSIIGGVEVATNQLQPDNITVGIKLTQPKQKTAECEEKIYNAANFLPKDRSLTLENTRQTLLGVVEYESGLQQAGEWLAETVFGSEKRSTNNSGSNRMHLRLGNLTQSIVELTLDPQTKTSETKNIITTVRKTAGEVQKEAIVEAGKIITNLGKGVNGCITQDEQTWKIYSAKDVGQFTYEGCMLPGTSEGGLIVRPNLACCELAAKSDIQSDASYSLDPNGKDPLQGMTQLDLYEVKEPKSNPNSYAKPGNKISYNSPYPLGFDTRQQAYQKSLLLCGISDGRTQQQANKQTVQTSATRLLDDVKGGPLKLQLRTCALDADDALSKAYAKGQGTWYATLDWEDDKESKSIKQAVEETTKDNKLGDSYVTFAGQGILASDNPVYREQFKGKQMAAVGSFALACAAACGVCQGAAAIATVGASLAASATDCLFACGIGSAMGAYEVSKDKWDGTVLEPAKDVIENSYGIVRDGAATLIPGSTEDDPATSALVAGGVIYPLIRGWKSPLPTKLTEKATALETEKVIKTSELGKKVGEATDALSKAQEELKKAESKIQAVLDEATDERVEVEKRLVQAHKQADETQKALDGFRDRERDIRRDLREAEAEFKKTRDADLKEDLKEEIERLKAERDTISRNRRDLTTAQERAVDDAAKAREELNGLSTSKRAAEEKARLDSIESLQKKLDEAQKKLSEAKEGSDTTSLTKAVEEAEKNLNEAEDGVKGLKKRIEEAEEALKKAKEAAEKEALKKAKSLKKFNFVRGLVCGGVGNIAGYTTYRNTLLEEIENKIVVEAGSTNVFDPSTDELIFQKGQTYAFTLSPTAGSKTSRKISIDIVSPDSQVNPNAWLDDCSKAST